MASRDEIRIGVTWSDSGWCWLDSRVIYPAVEIWIRETNARGGMHVPELKRHLPVRLVRADDRSDPETEIAEVTRLCERERIDVFCSSPSAEMQHEALPITEKHRVVNLNIGSPDPALFELGYRYHLQCSAPLRGLLRSRPAFWKAHGLTRIAQIYADFWGWNAVAAPLASWVEEQGLELVLCDAVPRHERWSTPFGPYPRDFDGWDRLVAGLAGLAPDAVLISLPSPAQYRIMREIRRQGVWFPYLEMMYGLQLRKIGFGTEDLLFQFTGSGSPPVAPPQITVGCSQEELDRMGRAFLGIEGPVYGRGYVGLAIWEHLVQAVGSMDPDAVMEQAQKESGLVVTMYGPMRWRPNGDAEPPDGWMDGVGQFLRHPWSGDLYPVRVFPDAERPPVLTREPVERRPDPWTATR